MPTKKMIRVCVTKSDIKRGARGSPTSCPVALAVARRVKGKVGVGSWIHFHLTAVSYLNPARWSARTPLKVREWISRYDRAQPVKPIAFLLPAPKGMRL